MENVRWIDKGLYSHPQPRGFMSLKQYMIFEKEGKKYLMLRFFNETSFYVSSMEFKLVQTDLAGKTIDSTVIKVSDMNAASGKTYALKNAIAISDKCTDFTVSVLWAFSNGYKYVLRHGHVIPTYDVRREQKKKLPRQSVKSSVTKITNKGHIAATLVSFGVMIAGVLLLAYLMTRSFGNFTTQNFTNLFF